MSKSEHIQLILNELYPETPIPLHHVDPYTLLVAVVLSAQCTDERVNQVTPTLFAKADNPRDMAMLSVDEIREIIRPCGLSPSKSKAIAGLSHILMEKYGGKVPDSFEALEALPGVGHKTASVVMSQAFGTPAFPVDTHIHRLAKRWGLSEGKNVEQTERDLKKVFPEDSWNRLHLQIIFLGRSYCPARGHNPAQCPVCALYGVEPGHFSLEKILNSLESQISAARPAYFRQLNAGLSDDHIATLENKFQLRLPHELRMLYAWKNGQDEECAEAFINNSMFLPLEAVLEINAEHTAMIGADFESEHWWRPGWLPVFDNGGGDNLCCDTEGFSTGQAGQIVEYRHDDESRRAIAPGLRAFLHQLVKYYENTQADSFDDFFQVAHPEGYPIKLI